MSQFNSSISILGIKEPKVQQAILKLLENCIYQRDRLDRIKNDLDEDIRLLNQKVSQLEKGE